MSSRTTLSLDGLWRFSPDPAGDGERLGFATPAYDARRWREVGVPSVFEAGCPDIDFYSGICWYRRGFRVPEGWQGRRLVLRFEGVNYRARVWVNGTLLGEHRDGFLPFEFTLESAALGDGEHLLVVEVDNANHAGDVPGMHVGWRGYGGILREVTLYATEHCYLDDLKIQAAPSAEGGDFQYGVRICNTQPSPMPAALAVTVYDAAGTVVAEPSAIACTVLPGEAVEMLVDGTVDAARCWSPDSPALYRAVARLTAGEALVDCVETHFGFRTIEATPDGLLLNGQRVFLTGFNRHEDSPHTAMAVDMATTRRDLEEMKTAGANFVRLCHYPHHPAELELCDELGLLVFAEIPLYFWHDLDEGRRTNAERVESAERQLAAMIARDFNHPSVIFWSVSNETHEDEAPVAASNRALIRRARALDPTRLCVHVSNHWTDTPNFAEDDVICVNGYPSMDWHNRGLTRAFTEGRVADVWRENLATLHNLYPEKPILITEFGYSSFAGTYDQSFGEDMQAQVIEQEFPAFDAAYLCGATIWCWADHPWEAGRFHGGLSVSPFGVLTRQRRSQAAYWTARRLFRARQGLPALPVAPWPHDASFLMIRLNLQDIPDVPFPAGYGLRPMTVQDIGLWTDIQRDAEPHLRITDTTFLDEFGDDLAALPWRCFLVTDPAGRGIGTISAWYCRDFRGEDYGRIHWVCLRPSAQGKGLGKAAMSQVLRIMAQWHGRCFLQTSPERLAAIKLYLDFGFLPDFIPAGARASWEHVQSQLKHPALDRALAEDC